jgi:hypothetical protein
MAKLNLKLTGSDVTGATGKDEDMFIIAYVTGETGYGVKGLKKTNFKVWKLGDLGFVKAIDTFFFAEIALEVPSVTLPGVYLLNLGTQSELEKGSFAFGVLVTSDAPKEYKAQGLVTIVRVK